LRTGWHFSESRGVAIIIIIQNFFFFFFFGFRLFCVFYSFFSYY